MTDSSNGESLPPNALISAAAIDYARGGTQILFQVGLVVRQGEIVTLIGPNGSGKTTLVRILLGILKPDAGCVRGKPGLTVGYVPQRLHIDTALPLTVRRLLSLPRKAEPRRLTSALEEVGANYLIDRQVQDLSGGETQRMLLARALLREPDLLVLDEPLQGIDFAGQLELSDLIARVRRRRGCGILMVSHDLHLVMAGTDQVVCLNHHVCCTGEPRNRYQASGVSLPDEDERIVTLMECGALDELRSTACYQK